MTDPKKPKTQFLRLVTPSLPTEGVTKSAFARPGWQNTLFANENASLAIFVNFEQVTELDFTTAISASRPKTIIDIRKVPRFDIGTLNRRSAFKLFARLRSQYSDLSGKMAKQDPTQMAEVIFSSRSNTPIEGPIAFLVDSDQANEGYISSLLESLPGTASPWDVLQVPGHHEKPQEQERNVIFISHANPQDNVFAFWLTQQLTLLGYETWIDISKLDGGELFWDDIENVIRNDCAKVIVVLSRIAQSKAGVLDEIDLSVRVERSRHLRRFVIPIRLDDLPFDQVRANLGRKNIIDFNKNWATGLHALAAALEKDRVPRAKGLMPAAMKHWIRDQLSDRNRLVSKAVELTSNWLSIDELPSRVRLYDVGLPLDKIPGAVTALRVPCFQYHRLIGTFSGPSAITRGLPDGVPLREEYSIDLQDFLEGNSASLPGMRSQEARRIASSVLRQAWDFAMRERGLIPFVIASGANAWYMPTAFLEGNKVSFVDQAGKRRRKSLVGWSERRQVFWHLAIEARPTMGANPHFVLRQHVIFTADGKTPVASKERMHLLRRRFCKSWWNDRWRDLLIGFVTWLGANDGYQISVGDNEFVTLASALTRTQSPLSVPSPLDETDPSAQEDELESDDLDDIEEGLESWQDEIEGP